MSNHVIKGNKGRSFKYGDNPSSGLVHAFSQKTKLSYNDGMQVACSYCGISFKRPASHLERVSAPCCSRACAAAIRVINIETKCIICHKIFVVIPSNLVRKTTCSKECSSMRRKSGKNLNIRSLAKVKIVIKEIEKRCYCYNCNSVIGPWVVRNIGATYENGHTEVNSTKAELWCKHCHLKNIAPLGRGNNPT